VCINDTECRPQIPARPRGLALYCAATQARNPPRPCQRSRCGIGWQTRRREFNSEVQHLEARSVTHAVGRVRVSICRAGSTRPSGTALIHKGGVWRPESTSTRWGPTARGRAGRWCLRRGSSERVAGRCEGRPSLQAASPTSSLAENRAYLPTGEGVGRGWRFLEPHPLGGPRDCARDCRPSHPADCLPWSLPGSGADHRADSPAGHLLSNGRGSPAGCPASRPPGNRANHRADHPAGRFPSHRTDHGPNHGWGGPPALRFASCPRLTAA
jgi:hypothetical protein